MSKALAGTGQRARRDLECYMVLAMAEFQSHNPERARIALAKGQEIAQKEMPSLENRDLTSGWQDWLIGFALMREAKALIPPELPTRAD